MGDNLKIAGEDAGAPQSPSLGDRLKAKISGVDGDGTAPKIGRPSNADKEAKKQKEDMEKQLREMFSDDVVEQLITLYPDLRFAMTGSEVFTLTEKDKQVLIRLTKPSLSLIPFKPEYIALGLMIIAMGKVYGGMEIAFAAQQKQLNKVEKRDVK